MTHNARTGKSLLAGDSSACCYVINKFMKLGIKEARKHVSQKAQNDLEEKAMKKQSCINQIHVS